MSNNPEREPNQVAPQMASATATAEASQIGVMYSVSISVAQAQVVAVSTSEEIITRAASLLLQTVIVPGANISEGRLIEAVAVPWFDIIAFLKTDPTIAFQIAWEKWEEIVAGAYTRAGFEEVILTPRSGDSGRDVIATKRGIGSVRVIDQVKAFKPGHLVSANDVRALYGVVELDAAAKGFLSTTSDFVPKIKSDPLLQKAIPSRIQLINGRKLFARLEELAKGKP